MIQKSLKTLLRVLFKNGCLHQKYIGDFTTFVKNNNCGIVVTDNLLASSFIKPVYEEKMILHRLAIKKFSKKVFKNEYRSMLLCKLEVINSK